MNTTPLLTDERSRYLARRRTRAWLWPLDVALILLGLLVMGMVMRLLRFDDPRVLYNAWTYFLAIPTIMIATSMISRTVISQTAERSIQIGFLMSVAFHLVMTLFAVRVVLLSEQWPDLFDKEYALSKSRQATQFHAQTVSATATPQQRPDYLKPVETPSIQSPERLLSEHTTEDAARIEPIVAPERIDPSIPDKPFDTIRKEISPTQPTISAAAKQLDRPDLNRTLNANSIDIDFPAVRENTPLPSQEIDAKPLKEDRSERSMGDRSSISSQPSSSIAPVEPNVSPKLNRDLPQSNRTTDNARARDRELELAIDRSAKNGGELPSNAVQRERLQSSNAIRSAPVPIPEVASNTVGSGKSVNGLQGEPNDSLRSNLSERSTARSRDSGTGPTLNAIPSAVNLPESKPGNGSMAGAKAAGNPASDTSLPSFLNDSRFAGGNSKLDRPIAGGSSLGPNKSIDIGSIAGSPNGGGDGSSKRSDAIGGDGNGSAGNSGATDGLSMGLDAILDAPTRSNMDRSRSGAGNGGDIALSAAPAGGDAKSWVAPFAGAPREGLSSVARDLELPDIRASDLSADRFRRPELGGPGLSRSVVPVPAPAFKQRLQRNKDQSGDDAGALGAIGPQTEEAIERGLEFLAKYQRDDGSWHLEDFGEKVEIHSNTAATALALLSFQGAGYTHQQFKYATVCKKGIDWLTRVQRKNGDLYEPSDDVSNRNAWLYSHAIASLAICEAYGMTQDESIKANAQAAIDFLVSSQDPNGGGWRYTPRVGSDTSVTGWCMMAMKSAELSGLQVPKRAYAGITQWLNSSEASARERYLYRYNWQAPDTPQTRHGRIPTPVMTSVGLLMRLYLGWRRDNPDMIRGADWLLDRPPAEGTPQVPLKDTYYWYYSTQILFHMGGERWKRWYETLYPMLIRSQETTGMYAGSWEPNGEIPDAWGKFAGRLYVTTLNLLSLEVYYRHLPIYDATGE